MAVFAPPDDLKPLVGQEIAASDWVSEMSRRA